jgi:peptide chain release factor 1
VGSGERAEKIRTYNFPQNRVTDHRVRMDRRLQDVVAGDLDPIVDELLAEERRRQLGADGVRNGSAG